MRKLLALLLIAVPPPTVASGSEVLASLWSEFALLAVVVVSLFVMRIPFRSKAFVFAAYLLSAIAVGWVTWGWPYRENQALIISMSLIVPGLCWLVALAVARWRRARL